MIRRPDNSEIIYVGKTRINTVSNRIRDHLIVNNTSDLKNFLIKNQNYPQDKNLYEVQYIQIDDERERTFFEHFTISVLTPKFNKQ